MPEEPTEPRYAPTNLFLMVEHAVYAALGGLLSIVALVALAHAAVEVVASILAFGEDQRIFEIMDQLLFVLMLAEILHTVRVSMRSGTLNAEPFLVVGLIASIRRVLVITLESSEATKGGGAAGDIDLIFRHSMTELGVLAGLILVMVLSIFMLRKTNRPSRGVAD